MVGGKLIDQFHLVHLDNSAKQIHDIKMQWIECEWQKTLSSLNQYIYFSLQLCFYIKNTTFEKLAELSPLRCPSIV